MADIAKVVTNDGGQVVQLPDQYRIDADEVEISRVGDTLILKPRSAGDWQRLGRGLEAFDEARFDDCFPAGREQPRQQERPDLDDLLG